MRGGEGGGREGEGERGEVEERADLAWSYNRKKARLVKVYSSGVLVFF